MTKFINTPVPGAKEFYSLNEPSIGTALPASVYPENEKIPLLFEPLTIRGITFKNRIWVSPMCMYSSDNGHATDFHLVHLGGFATRGVGAICVEATAVVPEGRISPEDAGLWTDSQIAPLKRIVDFCHAQGTPIGIQLAHAGRKASTLAPHVHLNATKTMRADRWVAYQDENGWPDNVVAPSKISFADDYPTPRAATSEDLVGVEDAFIAATKRAKQAGFDFVEVHAAHGYLFHEFLSPLSNTRTDQYGGQPLENRSRFPLKVIKSVREAWGTEKPLFVRLSATDWLEGDERGSDGKWRYWGVEQTKIFAEEAQKLGVDLIDVSSGGLWAKQNITLGPGYQVPFAAAVKSIAKVPVSAVGLITSPTQAETILQQGQADVIFLARELLRNPHWALYAARELGVAVKSANQYERSWTELPKKGSAV